MARSSRYDRRVRFGLLLLALLAVFAIEGIATPGRWEQVILSILLATTLVLAMQVADARPAVVWAAVVLGAIIIVLSLVEALENHVDAVPVKVGNLLLVTLTPPAVVVGIIRTLRARGQVTIEAVFGVLCVYLLLGMFFAALYGTIAQTTGTFFAQDLQATDSRCLYFSFTTLTTVGYGDLTAASNLGHTLSISEALFGQIYLVTVVSLIVSNLGRRRPGRAAAPERDE